MYLDGYTNIVNIDISEVCIERMRESHQSTPMEWKVADVTNLGDFEVTFSLSISICNLHLSRQCHTERNHVNTLRS